MSTETGIREEDGYVSFEEQLDDIEGKIVETYLENEDFHEVVKADTSPEEITEELEEKILTAESSMKKIGETLGYASNGAAVLFGAAYAASTGPIGLSVAATGVCGIEYMRRASKMDRGTNPEREYLSARVSQDLEVEEMSEEGLYSLELEPKYNDSELLNSESLLDYSPF